MWLLTPTWQDYHFFVGQPALYFLERLVVVHQLPTSPRAQWQLLQSKSLKKEPLRDLKLFSVLQYGKQSFASRVVISSPDRYCTCVSFMYKYQVQELAGEDSDQSGTR